MLKIGIHGKLSKTSKALERYVSSLSDCHVVYAYGRSANDGNNIADLIAKSDIIVDFSSKESFDTLLNYMLDNNIFTPIVSGTTGLSIDIQEKINLVSKNTAVLYSTNMSYTMNVMMILISKASILLKELNHDIEIIDLHHKNKKDAPSGTALNLGKIIANAVGVDFESFAQFDKTIPRLNGAIGFSSIRLSNNAGAHDVVFANDSEQFSLSHKTFDSAIYAHGSVVAAKWLINKKFGLYNMFDVFGISL